MRHRRRLTRDEALAIHAVLVALARAGAGDDAREDFVRHATRDVQVEYRFQGCLGFGGKFYWDGEDGRIGFYAENHSLLREAIVRCAAPRIAAIVGRPSPPEGDPYSLVATCAAAMDETGAALAEVERIRLSRGETDPALRPARGAMRKAETRLRASRDRLDAARLRAREALARRVAHPDAEEA